MVEHKITSKQLRIIANGNVNGIDISYFSKERVSSLEKVSLRRKLDINEINFVFVFVGRLVGDKGINELIQAFQKLSSKIQNVKLLLVGLLEIDLDPLKIETLAEINYNESIISVGFQKDISPYLAILDTLIFPSYREGFPNVVMWASAMGFTSIITNINGCNEIVIKEKTEQ